MPLSESMGDIGKNPQKVFVTKMEVALILCFLPFPSQGFFIFLFHCLLNSEVCLLHFLPTRNGFFISERHREQERCGLIWLVSGTVTLNEPWYL